MGHRGALQGPLLKSRIQGPIFGGLRGAHTLLGPHTLPTACRRPHCPHSVPSRAHGLQAPVCRAWQRPRWGPRAQESKGLRGLVRPVLMNSTASRQRDPEWHLSQPRLGHPTEGLA